MITQNSSEIKLKDGRICYIFQHPDSAMFTATIYDLDDIPNCATCKFTMADVMLWISQHENL